MVVIRESLQESSVWRVGQVPFPAVTLSVMSGSLSLQSSHSMFGVPLTLTWVNVLFGYACSSL
jgi:hypothetical protein